jgi:hypothetical protein
MKQVCRATALVLIITAVPAALAFASSAPSGTYETTVKTAGSLDGTYKITFTPGHFTLVAPYDITGKGTYSVSGSKMTLHGPSSTCTAAGLYEFKISGSSLTFHKIKDPCQRAEILTAHALKKV